MRVDVFSRLEPNQKHSHLVVPHGEPLPEEITDYAWRDEARDIDLDESAPRWPQYGIEAPGQQLSAKGYAITSLNKMTD